MNTSSYDLDVRIAEKVFGEVPVARALPFYSDSMVEAWKVVRELTQRHNYAFNLDYDAGADMWRARFEGDMSASARSILPSTAICRAALAVLESDA